MARHGDKNMNAGVSAEFIEDQTMYPFCRVCLVSQVRMCPIENNELQEIYAKLINTQASQQCAVPQAICYICYAQLQRSHRFRKMAHKSQEILEHMHQQGVEVHKMEMPHFENALKLSDINITSLPSSTDGSDSTEENASKGEIFLKQEIKTEVLSSQLEVNPLELSVDPNQTLKDENLSPMDASSSINMEHSPVISENNQSIHKKSTKDYLNTKQKDNLKNQTKKPNQKKVSCSICDKAFTCYSNLRSHMKTHTGEKPYKCQICDKSFGENYGLERHKKIHNSMYKCEICGNTYPHSAALHHHMSTHTGVEVFICKICNKGFSTKYTLQRHLKKIHKKSSRANGN